RSARGMTPVQASSSSSANIGNPAPGDLKPNTAWVSYNTLALLYGALGVASLVAPIALVEQAFFATPTVVAADAIRILGSTFVLVALIANRLSAAVDTNRLGNDTYKRLNLGLVVYGVASAVILWTSPAPATSVTQALATALSAATTIVAGRAFLSSEGSSLSPGALLNGLGNAAKTVLDTKNLTTLTYGVASVLASIAGAALLYGRLPGLEDYWLVHPIGSVGVYALRQLGAGALLAATVLYTLKDAAGRGRLRATTFKSLNAGVAGVSAAVLFTIAGWVRSGSLATSVIATSELAAAGWLLATVLYQYFYAPRDAVEDIKSAY
ncbi:hypothetical protein APUTEX25_005638, partial [Auxenochlorella protothecoides]